MFIHRDRDPCECCPAAVLSEEEMVITPERKPKEWRAVSSSTPVADLREPHVDRDAGGAVVESPYDIISLYQ